MTFTELTGTGPTTLELAGTGTGLATCTGMFDEVGAGAMTGGCDAIVESRGAATVDSAGATIGVLS